ncbi:MAG: ROK family protein [Ignavibacteriae bacterium]|nr:ROK family protein [Ignavibacteriota bacterium]
MPYFPPDNKEFNSLRHVMLMYGNANTPWTQHDLKYYVAYCNEHHREDDWLYDSFLFLNVKSSSGRDLCADINLGTSMAGEGDFFAMVSPNPANKKDWIELLDFYLGEQGALHTLDAEIDQAQRNIGKPYGAKRNVVLMLPYPHLTQESFGDLDGTILDFSINKQNLAQATRQRLKAEKWFVDEIAARFKARTYKHVHLLGVYWMFETVYRGWNVDDHWLLKELRTHIHLHGLKFLWIPFWSSYNVHLLDEYQKYYFDLAFLQPNFMFYAKGKGVGDAARAARKRNAGIELEYYLELQEPVTIENERHPRFRDYLNGGVTYGYMNHAACAHFQGVGSLQRMHSHPDPQEREFYDDLYHFIKGDYKLKSAIPRPSTDKRDCALAVDLGGTQLRAAIVSDCGEIVERKSIATPPTKDAIISAIIDLLKKLNGEVERLNISITGIGVSTGGRVDFAEGVVVDSTALLADWKEAPLRALLTSAMRLPTVIDNDGNCAALAEQMFGDGRSSSNFISLVLGTGIGGGVVVNDEILRGANNAAAELGHISIDYDGPLCSCGNRGCVELYSSGSGLARLARDRAEAGNLTLPTSSPDQITAQLVGEAARNGNEEAALLVEQGGRMLGYAVSGLINTFNPERVILSGSLLNLGEEYLRAFRDAVDERAMKTARESALIITSQLSDSPLLGAAALVFENRPPRRAQ